MQHIEIGHKNRALLKFVPLERRLDPKEVQCYTVDLFALDKTSVTGRWPNRLLKLKKKNHRSHGGHMS